jgi:hypothetical protein
MVGVVYRYEDGTGDARRNHLLFSAGIAVIKALPALPAAGTTVVAHTQSPAGQRFFLPPVRLLSFDSLSFHGYLFLLR